MIIEIKPKLQIPEEEVLQFSAGDSGSESPDDSIVGETNTLPRSRKSSDSAKKENFPDIFSPRYGPIIGTKDIAKMENGLPPSESLTKHEDRYAIFSPNIFHEEPEVFPESPLSERSLGQHKNSIFSPRPEAERRKEPANPFSMFSPKYPKITPAGATPTFHMLLANLEEMKEQPYFRNNDSAGCLETFRSPRYSHVVSPIDVNSFDPSPSLRSGCDDFQLTSSVRPTTPRLIQAN